MIRKGIRSLVMIKSEEEIFGERGFLTEEKCGAECWRK